ncbi:MAG: YccF domain-containing protein [Roseburia sp.]
MNCLGNIIWFLCCGLWQGIFWEIAGILWSITIVGIPIGRQCFKLARLAFFPFGKEVQYGGSTLSFIANIFWLLISGIPLALSALCNGLLLCCTIIGIPFGIQCFKIAKLALTPFGANIIQN